MAPPHPEVMGEGQRLKATGFLGKPQLFTAEITIFSRNKLLVICYQRRRMEIRTAGGGDASALTTCYSATTKYSTVVFALT
jgi:hypothetical protein